MQQNAKFIEDKRSQITFAPKDSQEVANFLSDMDRMQSPLYKYVVARQKLNSLQVTQSIEAAKLDKSEPAESSSDESMEDDEEPDLVEDFNESQDDESE